METKQENFQISIETITPVHVGSGRKLMANSEFIIRQVRKANGDIIKKIGIIDEEKVLGIIGADRIEDWMLVIEKNQDLFQLLKTEKTDVNFSHFSVRTLELNKRESGSENFLKEHIITAGRPFIPGSSIKGSIRTALLTAIMNEKSDRITDQLFYNSKGKLSDEKIQEQLFGKDPNNDLFRFIQIGDFHFGKNTTIALNVLNINIKKIGAVYDPSKSVLTECIPAGENAKGRIKMSFQQAEHARLKAGIDRNLVLPQGISQLIKIINVHTLTLIDQEIEIWSDYAKDVEAENYIRELNWIKSQIKTEDESSCILRLGHGAGWRFMTGSWPESEILVSEEIQEKMVNAARPNNHLYQDYIFPKSRRLDENGDLLGFVRLTLI